MAKSNFEKVESVVGWVRDKKITGYRISKETNARDMPVVQLPRQILSRTMDGTKDSFSTDPSSLGRSLFNLWWTRVCGIYPENQARRQQSSYREIFYQPPETGARLR